MSNPKYQTLVEKYPLLFQHPPDSKMPFPMFGFECGTGWYHIIENACRALYADYQSEQRMVDYLMSCKLDLPGYVKRIQTVNNDSEQTIVADLESSITMYESRAQEERSRLPRFVQIKEKFGTLRLYMDKSNDFARGIEMFAEAMSATVCEVCGNLGKTHRIGWHNTLCSDHALEKYGPEALVDEQEEMSHGDV